MAHVAVDLVNLIESETSMPATGPTVVDYSTFIHYWLEILKQSDGHIIGVSGQVTPGAVVPGTFPPTSLNLQEYEYKDPSKTDTSNNCLVYAQMVEINGIADPVPNPPYYFYTGNIVDAGKHGTMMISQKAFWTNWLLPLMQEVNYLTWINQAYVHNSGIEGSEDWTWGCKIGVDAANGKTHADPVYAWTQGVATPATTAPNPVANAIVQWTWDGGESRDDANHGIDGSLVQSYLIGKFPTPHTLSWLQSDGLKCTLRTKSHSLQAKM